MKGGERVLEIGFGTGWALAEIDRMIGGEGGVVGVDISRNMVNIARGKTKGHPSGKLHPLLADAKGLPLREDVFDCVLMAETLELMGEEDMERVLREIQRVMKSKGEGAFVLHVS